MDQDVFAGKLRAIEVAQAIVDGRIPPYEGARRMWMDVWPQISEDKLGDRLLGFIGEATEWDAHPEARPVIEEGIRRNASKLLAEWGDEAN